LGLSIVAIAVGIVVIVSEVAGNELKLGSTDGLGVVGDNPGHDLRAGRGCQGTFV